MTIRIEWQTAPHRRAADAQIADVSGVGRLLVKRDGKGKRTFTGFLNGNPVARGDCLADAQTKAARVARDRAEACPASGEG